MQLRKFSDRLRLVTLIILTVSLLGLGTGCKERETELTESKVVPVVVEVAGKGTLTFTVDFDAYVQLDTVPVSFKVPGKVVGVFVREGERVKRGQLLAVLDKTDYLYKVERVRAMYQQALAGYNAMKASSEVQNLQADTDLGTAKQFLKQAEAQLYTAEANYRQAKRDYERMRELWKEGAISKHQYESAELGFKSAENALNAARAAYRTAKERLKLAMSAPQRKRATSASLQAQWELVQSAKSALDDAMKALKDTELVSPVDGVVVTRNVNVGQLAGPSMPAFIIAVSSTPYVKGLITDSQAKLVSVGRVAEMEIPALKVQTEGKITELYPLPKAIPMFQVKLKFRTVPQGVSHGDYVRVHVPYKKVKGILINRDAVMFSEGENFVFVIRDQVAKRVQVKLVATKGKRAIVEGLEVGDKVVVEGQYFLRDGMRVKVKRVVK